MSTRHRDYRTKDGIIQSSGKLDSFDRRQLRARPYPSLIPEGEYFAVATGVFWDTKSRTYGEKLYFDFRIVGGEHSGTGLRMYVRPSVFPTSNYYRVWSIANDGPPRSRNTKLSPKVLIGKLFRTRVATVKPKQRIIGPDGKAHLGDFLPDHLWYSKILCLISLEITNATVPEFSSNSGS